VRDFLGHKGAELFVKKIENFWHPRFSQLTTAWNSSVKKSRTFFLLQLKSFFYPMIIHIFASLHLGAVYTCDFPYESPYDSVYDLLPKMSSKLVFKVFWSKCKKNHINGWQKENLIPILFAYKSCTKSYGDSDADLDSCRRPLLGLFSPPDAICFRVFRHACYSVFSICIRIEIIYLEII
jgi:hypothetical protein